MFEVNQHVTIKKNTGLRDSDPKYRRGVIVDPSYLDGCVVVRWMGTRETNYDHIHTSLLILIEEQENQSNVITLKQSA